MDVLLDAPLQFPCPSRRRSCNCSCDLLYSLCGLVCWASVSSHSFVAPACTQETTSRSEAPWCASCLPRTRRICSSICDLLYSLHGHHYSLCGLRGLIHGLRGFLRSVDSNPITMCLNDEALIVRKWTKFVRRKIGRRPIASTCCQSVDTAVLYFVFEQIMSTCLFLLLVSPASSTHHASSVKPPISFNLRRYRNVLACQMKWPSVNDLWIVTLS